MIRPIRTVHRWAVLALSGLLPLVFAAGLAVRRAGPPASETRQLLGPDVLAYWSRFEPPGDIVPDGAKFLGTAQSWLAGKRPVPRGYVLLYSVAHHKIVRKERR